MPKKKIMKEMLMLCALFLIITTLFGCAATGSEQTGTSAPTSTESTGGDHHGHH
jgi:hypothetical protein